MQILNDNFISRLFLLIWVSIFYDSIHIATVQRPDAGNRNSKRSQQSKRQLFTSGIKVNILLYIDVATWLFTIASRLIAKESILNRKYVVSPWIKHIRGWSLSLGCGRGGGESIGGSQKYFSVKRGGHKKMMAKIFMIEKYLYSFILLD